MNADKEKYKKIFKGDGSLNEDGLSLDDFVKSYDPKIYDNPSPTVDTAVFSYKDLNEHGINGLKLLLIRRRNHPSIGFWALPGGFVEMNEDISHAAARELMEETGVSSITPVQVKTFGSPERDPRTTIITTLFTALINENSILPKAGDDADDAAFFDIKVQEEDGMINLSLKNEEKDLTLSAVLKKQRKKSGILYYDYYEIAESDHIAMDHAILIMEAWEYIKISMRSHAM